MCKSFIKVGALDSDCPSLIRLAWTNPGCKI